MNWYNHTKSLLLIIDGSKEQDLIEKICVTLNYQYKIKQKMSSYEQMFD